MIRGRFAQHTGHATEPPRAGPGRVSVWWLAGADAESDPCRCRLHGSASLSFGLSHFPVALDTPRLIRHGLFLFSKRTDPKKGALLLKIEGVSNNAAGWVSSKRDSTPRGVYSFTSPRPSTGQAVYNRAPVHTPHVLRTILTRK